MIIPREPQAIPSKVIPKTVSVKLPITATSATAAQVRLTGLLKLTLLSIQMRIPSMPMRPYSTKVAPPSTHVGMVKINAPNSGYHAQALDVVALPQYDDVVVTRYDTY